MAVNVTELALRGPVLDRSSEGYDSARKLYNAMFDKRPAVIAQCADVDDVVAAVRFGRQNGLDTAIRCGGHNGAGLGSVDDGLVIDLSSMRDVQVDADSKVVRVSGGALFGDIDAATHEAGMATPGGIISTTGAAGLVLGGGIGHLTRKYGLSIDNVVAADVVLADGSVVTADENQNDDLLWALKGGGGNFGVVTSMTLRLHPVKNVVGGPMFWPVEHARELMRWYLEWRPSTPTDLNSFFLFHSVPPSAPFPEELWMKKVCGIAACWLGAPKDADEVLADARAQPGLVLDAVGEAPFPGLQSAFDPIYPAGDQWYWRADFFDSIPDEAVDINAEWGERLPTWKSLMHLYTIDGAPHDVAQSDSAWSYRSAQYAQVICGVDPDPANAGAIRDWAVGYWDAVHPYSAGGAYVNFMMDEGQERVQATYGPNYERLTQVKRKYDPDNFFHVNQNIKPA